LIKGAKATPLQPAIRAWIAQFKPPANVRVIPHKALDKFNAPRQPESERFAFVLGQF